MIRRSAIHNPWTYALLGSIACAGCNSSAPSPARESATAATSSSAKPKPAGGDASNKVPPRLVPDSGRPTASTSSTGSAPSADKPATPGPSGAIMPADVKRCEAHEDALSGSWTPTVDEIALAATALKEDVCLKPAIRESAIRACAAKISSPVMVISTDDLKGPSGCEEHIGAIESGGRKFVVFFGFFRAAAAFDGGSRAVELTSSGPKLYLDSLGPHGSLCPTTGGDPLKPADLPVGWAELPKATQDFLCASKK